MSDSASAPMSEERLTEIAAAHQNSQGGFFSHGPLLKGWLDNCGELLAEVRRLRSAAASPPAAGRREAAKRLVKGFDDSVVVLDFDDRFDLLWTAIESLFAAAPRSAEDTKRLNWLEEMGSAVEIRLARKDGEGPGFMVRVWPDGAPHYAATLRAALDAASTSEPRK